MERVKPTRTEPADSRAWSGSNPRAQNRQTHAHGAGQTHAHRTGRLTRMARVKPTRTEPADSRTERVKATHTEPADSRTERVRTGAQRTLARKKMKLLDQPDFNQIKFHSYVKSPDSQDHDPEPVPFPDVSDLSDEEDFINSKEEQTETLPMQHPIEKSVREMLHDEIANLRREKDEILERVAALEKQVQSSVLRKGAVSVHNGAVDVVERFEDAPGCLEFFYKEKVPALGSTTPHTAHLCQRFVNRYHFATLYDTQHRIAVYSAYYFQPSNGGGREKRWFVEPQLVNSTWQSEMKDGYWLGKDHPEVYLGENQALNEDYTHSGFDRGHLNPNGHHPVPSRNATFTLTNVIPQNPKLNQNSWRIHESELTELFLDRCSKAFVLVGAVPSADNWIIKNNVKRVNIPDHIWNAWCCLDNNGVPVQSGAGVAQNTEENVVQKLSLEEMGEFLQQFSDQSVGELFHNNCRP
ncbi:hypothetical protein WMY93_029000 [Mugilogobius chulae]|uniref:DNA/RNA non-specific endonuclease domain-containing protein n=1 Tax=Mugilogobius chulae TaxID=88201 RepID=A0AAW0MW26_9GOBI